MRKYKSSSYPSLSEGPICFIRRERVRLCCARVSQDFARKDLEHLHLVAALIDTEALHLWWRERHRCIRNAM